MVDSKRLFASAAVAAALTLGVGTAVVAQQGALLGQEDEAGEKNEAAETRRLEGLAKIDGAAAEKAALDAVPGEVKQIELEDEDGYVVYEVEVDSNDGRSYGVVVDAGNGKILAQETEEDED